MSVNLTINGTTYAYPEQGDSNWGVEATSWATAVTSGMLQKAGGTFQLLADVDFGTGFGLKSLYYKTRTANIASTGEFRLARADTITWRNEANDGDLELSVNASNELQFNGADVGLISSVSDTSTIDLTLTGSDLSADIVALSITNSLISASAAIAFSKMAALTTGRMLRSNGSGVVEATGILIDGSNNIVTPEDITVFDGDPNEFAVGKQLFELLSTGLESGGEITVGAPTSTYDIAAGLGHIVDQVAGSITEVSWNAFTGLTPAGNGVYYIYIDSLGAVVESTSQPTPDARRDDIYLGRIVVRSGVVITAQNEPVILREVNQQVYDMAKAMELFNVSGIVFTPNGANLSLNRSAGDLFSIGANFQTDPKDPSYVSIGSASPVTFQQITQTAATGSNVTVITPGNYDNAGTITAIGGSPNQATNMRVYQFPSGAVRIAYGQVIHSSLVEAIQNIPYETFVVNPDVPGNGLLRAVISVKAGATVLNDTNQARIVSVSRFGEAGAGTSGSGTTNLQQAYDNSLNGEILVDSTTGEIIFKDASSTIGTVFKVVDNAGTTNYLDVASTGVSSEVPVTFTSSLDVDNIKLDLNTISTTNSNGNLLLVPNGTGKVQISANKGLLLADDDSSVGVTVKVPAVLTGNWTLTLPDNDGASGQFLQTNGSGVTSWANASLGTVSAKAANYVILDDDGIFLIAMTTGAGTPTVTLPTASANTNRIIALKKVDTGTGNVTLAGEGAETIDGNASELLVMPNETIVVQCDGSNWFILDRYYGDEISTTWTDNQANATTNVRIMREGPNVVLDFYISVTGALSGAFEITVPSTYATSLSFSNDRRYIYNNMLMRDATGDLYVGLAQLITSTTFYPQITNTGLNTITNLSATVPFTWASGDLITINDVRWPVTGW